jgi:chromosome segregation ATPase
MMRGLSVLLFGVSLVLVGCGEDKQAPPAQTSPPAVGASEQAPQEKEGYASAVQKQLDEMKLEIEALKADTKTASAEAKAKLNEQIAALEQKWQAAEKQFQDLKAASGETWRDMRAGMESALADLRQTLTSAKQSA